MAVEFNITDYRKRMDGAVSSLRTEFSGLRTGRANTALLDNITIEAYGSSMPLNQVGNVSVPEARMLVVSVWDKTQVQAVEKALRQSNLGINPVVDGQTIRILKKAEKDGMSEDERKAHEGDVQKATDAVIGEIESALESKSAEIMQV